MIEFARNQVLREEVKQYLLQVFRDEAIELVFNRKDVSHIADAVELVETAFDKMEVEFAAKKEISNLNEAR